MLCPNCRHWNEPDARFCEECGTELKQGTQDSAQVSVKPVNGAPASVPVRTDGIPDPPPQTLVPGDAPVVAAPIGGPRLVLDATGSIFKLGEVTTIGREDPRLQIDFDGYPDGKYVSHQHARVMKLNGQYYVEDLGSSNHTWVNDIRLVDGQSQRLNEGDRVRFGKIELTFHES
jgi:pSer/pThr/pTyr-binding forkhead associated (FHA) protein